MPPIPKPPGLPNMTEKEAMEYLRQSFDNDLHRARSRVDLLCERWRIVQHPGSLAAYKLAEHYMDDYFPWGDRTEPAIPEAEVRELFAFTDRFCRQYDFADVSKERKSDVGGVVLGCLGDNGGTLTFDDAWAVLKPGQDRPLDWYRWTATQLGLYPTHYWRSLDADIRRLAQSWGDDNDDKGLADRLYCTVDIVQWGRRQSGAAEPLPPPPVRDGQHRPF